LEGGHTGGAACQTVLGAAINYTYSVAIFSEGEGARNAFAVLVKAPWFLQFADELVSQDVVG